MQAESRLDGFYVLRTRVSEATLLAEEVVRSYKRLSTVARAFGSSAQEPGDTGHHDHAQQVPASRPRPARHHSRTVVRCATVVF